MRKLLVLALVGLASQLVDGALGMGYGVTSSSLLLLAGLSPALASASVHLSEIGTTLVSGTAHHRLGNTDWRLVARLGGPGAVGAFLGATVLSRLSTGAAAPATSPSSHRACAAAWRWQPLCSPAPPSSSWTSRPTTSTRRPSPSSSGPCAAGRAPSCSPVTTVLSSTTSPPASSISTPPPGRPS